MNVRKEFVFKNVLPFDIFWIILVVIICMIIYSSMYLFLFKGHFRLGFVLIFTILYFATCYGILKKNSSKIIIWFDDSYMYIKKENEKEVKYSKQEIIDFYSYDYETKSEQLKNSKIYFRFHTKNKILFFNDIEYRNRYEAEKGENLKKFLVYAQKELNFKKIESKKLQNVNWYSI